MTGHQFAFRRAMLERGKARTGHGRPAIGASGLPPVAPEIGLPAIGESGIPIVKIGLLTVRIGLPTIGIGPTTTVITRCPLA